MRYKDEILLVPSEQVDYTDVSPKQTVSIATALIPFLENDDASRALMGSNMQRQAVPLLRTDAPLVGTGMEYKAAVDSGIVVVAQEAGHVTYVSADEVVIKTDKGNEDRYRMIKFSRSNQGTCLNQKPLVRVGQRVEKGEVIADGPSTDRGRARPRAQRPHRLHAVGRLQLSRTRSSSAKSSSKKMSSHRSISKSTRRRRAIPSSGPRRSRATSPTSARRSSKISTRTASFASAPRCVLATSSSAR